MQSNVRSTKIIEKHSHLGLRPILRWNMIIFKNARVLSRTLVYIFYAHLLKQSLSLLRRITRIRKDSIQKLNSSQSLLYNLIAWSRVLLPGSTKFWPWLTVTLWKFVVCKLGIAYNIYVLHKSEKTDFLDRLQVNQCFSDIVWYNRPSARNLLPLRGRYR